jgi:hypothetical protein
MVGHGLNAQGEMTHMVRRAWKFKRAALAIAIALTVLSHSALVSHCFADECQCGGGCVERCPAALPVLETLCGQSLFWHDPCGNGYRDREYDCYFHESTPPRWYASAEFVPLFRDQSGSQPFQALATFDDTTATWNRQSVLSTSDFDADFEPGFRVTAGRALGDWYRIEVSYLGAHSWSDSAEVRYNARLPIRRKSSIAALELRQSWGRAGTVYPFRRVRSGPAFDLQLSLPASASNQKMDNGEVNLRRRVRTVPDRQVRAETSCLVGLRYMNIRESFGYQDSVDISGDKELRERQHRQRHVRCPDRSARAVPGRRSGLDRFRDQRRDVLQ